MSDFIVLIGLPVSFRSEVSKAMKIAMTLLTPLLFLAGAVAGCLESPDKIVATGVQIGWIDYYGHENPSGTYQSNCQTAFVSMTNDPNYGNVQGGGASVGGTGGGVVRTTPGVVKFAVENEEVWHNLTLAADADQRVKVTWHRHYKNSCHAPGSAEYGNDVIEGFIVLPDESGNATRS